MDDVIVSTEAKVKAKKDSDEYKKEVNYAASITSGA